MPFTHAIPEMKFVEDIDRLKSVTRQTLLLDGSRKENTAEHSWHLAMAVIALRGYANQPIDLDRAVQFALIHDIVEIDAGDTFVYALNDPAALQKKQDAETKAAERIFGLLSEATDHLASRKKGSGSHAVGPSHGEDLKKLWLEYEKQECMESRFVNALDRFLPMLANYRTGGYSWKNHKVPPEKVFEKTKLIAPGSEKLYAFAVEMIEDAVKRGMFG